MSRFFSTRAEQDGAVERLLRSLGHSIKKYPVSFIERLDGSDHQVNAAMLMGYVDIWITDTLVWVRLSYAGREWLAERP